MQVIFLHRLILDFHPGVALWSDFSEVTEALDVCHVLMATAQRLADDWRHCLVRLGRSAGLKALKQAWG